jgi:hypothetical protein
VRALVVMLVDLLDVSGTLMGKVRDGTCSDTQHTSAQHTTARHSTP